VSLSRYLEIFYSFFLNKHSVFFNQKKQIIINNNMFTAFLYLLGFLQMNINVKNKKCVMLMRVVYAILIN